MYKVAPMELPVPEFYVVYTGREGEVPDELSFTEAILGGSHSSVEVRARVLRLYSLEEGD